MSYRILLIFMVFISFPAAAYSPHSDSIAGPVAGAVTEVLDGDTVAVKLHVWIGEDIETHVRIAGIDAPEIHGKCEKERALAARARQEIADLTGDGRITLYDVRLEKYAGRVMAGVRASDGTDIGGRMIARGLARPYHGEKRRTWCGV